MTAQAQETTVVQRIERRGSEDCLVGGPRLAVHAALLVVCLLQVPVVHGQWVWLWWALAVVFAVAVAAGLRRLARDRRTRAA